MPSESVHRFVILVGEEQVYELETKPSSFKDPDVRRLVLNAYMRALDVATPGVEVKLETVARDPARDA